MPKIISMSLNEELLRTMDAAQKELGFSGRSETIRAAMKLLLDDYQEKGRMEGTIECVMLVMHSQKGEDAVTKAKHAYEGIINTQIHANLSRGKCMEIFVLNGDAVKVKEFYGKVRAIKKVENAKLVVA
ncbi:MAG TPA: CopG family ribbon-helix-helix protein [archaeon]|nr:CopG family ribbon-helix-helix protein [archaeon]